MNRVSSPSENGQFMENNVNPLWDFSLKAYGYKKVEENCLKLQDSYDLDVNLLFLFIWSGFSGAKLTDDSIDTIMRHAKAWQESAVLPLRNLRKQLKSDIGAVSVEKSAGFRTRIKEAELEAERIQQDMLMELLLKSPAVNARDGERKSVARRNLLGYLKQNAIPIDQQIKHSFEEILECSEHAFLSVELAENENQEE